MSLMETEQIMSCGTLCTEHINRGAIFVLSVIAYFSMVMCTGKRCEALSEKTLNNTRRPDPRQAIVCRNALKVSWISGDYYQGAYCFARICLWGPELWGL